MSVHTDYNAAGTFDAAAAADEARSNASVRQSGMNREDFLKLLVAQLSHQDPLNPLQGHEFAAHLAQFTSVEQLININDGIAGQGEINGILAQSINSGVAAGLIGKNVEATANGFALAGGNAVTGGVELAAAATSLTVTIKNSADQVIRTIDLGAQGEGMHQFTWDGKDDAGATAADGDYTFEISAKDGNGDEVASAPVISGVVDRVTFSQDGIKLWINGTPIAMGAVKSVE